MIKFWWFINIFNQKINVLVWVGHQAERCTQKNLGGSTESYAGTTTIGQYKATFMLRKDPQSPCPYRLSGRGAVGIRRLYPSFVTFPVLGQHVSMHVTFSVNIPPKITLSPLVSYLLRNSSCSNYVSLWDEHNQHIFKKKSSYIETNELYTFMGGNQFIETQFYLSRKSNHPTMRS